MDIKKYVTVDNLQKLVVILIAIIELQKVLKKSG
jgi:hypothetical protein